MAAPSPPLETLSPALQALADEVADLPVQLATVPDWGDHCSACQEPADGGPEHPHDAAAYIRRELTVGNVTTEYREPVCALCLRGEVRWNLAWRPARVVLVDLIEVAS